MIDRRLVTDAEGRLADALRRRGPGGEHVDQAALRALAERRLEGIQTFERLRAEQNERQRAVQAAPKGTDEFRALISGLKELSARVKTADADRKQAEEALDEALLLVPNPPAAAVPAGGGEEDNVELRRWGAAETPPWSAPHYEVGERLGVLDFAQGARVAGARFVVLRGAGARLERALMQLMLDMHTEEHGYAEVMPPFLVNRQAMTGTGQLPKFEDDAFKTVDPELFLVPTAEVPVTNLHAGQVLDASDLPLRYAAYTPCFRREAGAYGKDTRGLIRLHQFNKVELVWFTEPGEATAAHDVLVGHAEAVLQRLDLPYRVVDLCGADLGFSAARCYDLEVWFPAQGRYREISSCSSFTDFQARRANIRYRPDGEGKPKFVHTLNGSALAIGRCAAAILENHLQQDGSVRIPEALRRYMGGRELL